MTEMKYIKCFENHNKFYKEISEEEFDSIDILKFTSMEQKYIDRIFQLNFIKEKETFLYFNTLLSLRLVFGDKDKGYIGMNIYQLEDEYFLVELPYEKNCLHKIKYFKCDQFEGLLKLIEDYA